MFNYPCICSQSDIFRLQSIYIQCLAIKLCGYLESNRDWAAYKWFDLLYVLNVLFGLNGLYLCKNFKMGK